jgi:uncharacterized membrane protein
MKSLRRIAVGVVTLVALDFLWLGTIASSFYSARIATHLNLVEGVMQAKPLSAFLTWILIVLGIELFALPRAAEGARPIPRAAAAWGALFGLIAYGIYELTNHALFHSWPVSVVVVDMAWGTFLCGAVAAVMIRFVR